MIIELSSQSRMDQKVQDDTYSNLTPTKKPEDPSRDPIRNPGIEQAPDPEVIPFPGSNPSQYPERHPDEIPVEEPNEIPDQKL